MNEAYLKNVIEAALLASGRPLAVEQIAQLFDEHVRPSAAEVRTQLGALSAEYAPRGIEMKETASGFRVQVRGALASEISRLWPERPPRFSRALLETLALISYRQPITRAEIEAVRGVAVNPNILKTLIERNWVRVVGERDVVRHPEEFCVRLKARCRRQRVGAHQHASAGGRSRRAMRIIHPGERIEHLEEENESRHEHALGKTFAAQFRHQRSQDETAALGASDELRQRVRGINDIGIGQQQHRCAAGGDTLRDSPEFAGPPRGLRLTPQHAQVGRVTGRSRRAVS